MCHDATLMVVWTSQITGDLVSSPGGYDEGAVAVHTRCLEIRSPCGILRDRESGSTGGVREAVESRVGDPVQTYVVGS